jgi:cytoskeletal protein CcmA (bactofilin family)
LKSQAHVIGDIHHQSLSIESGAFFDGRSVHARANGQAADRIEKKSVRQIAGRGEAVPGAADDSLSQPRRKLAEL